MQMQRLAFNNQGGLREVAVAGRGDTRTWLLAMLTPGRVTAWNWPPDARGESVVEPLILSRVDRARARAFSRVP